MFSSYSGQIAAWLPFVNIDGNTETFVDNIEVDQVFTPLGITVTVVPMNSTSIMSAVGWGRAGRRRRLGSASLIGGLSGVPKEVGGSVRPSGGFGAPQGCC